MIPQKQGALIWPNESDFYSEKNYIYVQHELDMVYPQKEQKLADLVIPQSAPDMHEQPKQTGTVREVLTGTINYFNPEKKYGFILKDNIHRYFFYIKQVYDKTLMRLLLTGNVKKYNVTFILGTTFRGECAADRVELTNNALAKLNPSNTIDQSTKRMSGFVSDYNPMKEIGLISCQETHAEYPFKPFNITDPYLRAYLTDTFNPAEIDVQFFLKQSKNTGKYFCDQVISLEDFSQEQRKRFEQQYITSDELESWLSDKTNEEDVPLKNEAREQVTLWPYEPLEPWVPSAANPTEPENPPIPEFSRQVQEAKKGNPFLALEPWPEGASTQNLIDRAHRHLVNGELSQAKEFYINAIRANERIETAVPDLLTIYLRTNEIQQSVYLLDAFGHLLTYEKRLNLRIQVYDKAKTYDDELITLLNDAISYSPKVNTKLHYTMKLGDILQKNRKYKEAIEVYSSWLELREKNQYSVRSTSTTIELNIKRRLAYCYYLSGDTFKAKELASMLVTINAADQIASAILQDKLTENNISLLGEETIINIGDTEPNSVLPAFIRDRLTRMNLSDVIKNRFVDETGKYIGNPDQAVKDMELCIGGRDSIRTPKARSERILAAAKILDHLLQQGKQSPTMNQKIMAKRLNRQKLDSHLFERLLGRSTSSYGDYLLQTSNYIDSVRYCYIYAHKLLDNSEQDYHNTVNRFIASFFYAKNELMQDVVSPGSQMFSSLDYIHTKECFNLNELVIGLFELFNGKNDLHDSVIKTLFNSQIRDNILDIFEKIWEERTVIANPQTSHQFRQLWDSAAEQYFTRKRDYMNELEKISESILDTAKHDRQLQKLTDLCNSELLCSTDNNRLRHMHTIVDKAQRYNDVTDFESKVETLSTMDKSCDNIIAGITDYPTDIGCEVLLPCCEKMKNIIQGALSKLYTEFSPNLTISVEDEVFGNEQTGEIQVYVKISNKPNLQAADNFEIQASGEGLTSAFEDEAKKHYIKGGHSHEELFKFTVTKEMMSQRICTLELKIQYQHHVDLLKVETCNIKQTHNINLYNQSEFQVIPNRFSPYKGGQAVVDSDMFYGRQDEIEHILSSISLENGSLRKGHAVALYGQKRAGKSSIMYYLKLKLQEKYSQNSIVINMGSLGMLGEMTALPGFLYTILKTLSRELKKYPDICEKMEAIQLEVPYNKILTMPQNAEVLFSSFFEEFNTLIHSGQQDYTIVLMIDEFTYIYDWIRSGHMTPNFMQFWKAIMQNLKFLAVIAAQDSMPKFISEYMNEFVSMDLIKITYLRPGETRQLITEPIQYENYKTGQMESRFREDALEKILDLTAGSAFLTMILCAELVDYLNAKRSIYVPLAVLNEFLQQKVFCENSYLQEAHFEAQFEDKSDFTVMQTVLTTICNC